MVRGFEARRASGDIMLGSVSAFLKKLNNMVEQSPEYVFSVGTL